MPANGSTRLSAGRTTCRTTPGKASSSTRAASFVKRLLLRFDDAVTVRRDGADLEMEGARRVLVRIATHVESNTANDHE